MRYKNVVWDWNGTLLDDVAVGHGALKGMLERRGLGTITLQEYKDLFGFPVREFYEGLGFDFSRDDWQEVSQDFVDSYDLLAGGMELNRGVREVLANLQRQGVKQYILSALQEDTLQKMVVDFGIGGYFERVCGADDICADGKVHRGMRMVADCGILAGETLMVGDTLHDAEEAAALGFGCRLFAGGHNSEWRLQEKASVIREMPELLTFISNEL